MKEEKEKLYAVTGLLLGGLGVLRCGSLGSEPASGVIFFLAALAWLLLSLLLLRHEGYSGETVLKMLLPIGAALLLRSIVLPHATPDYETFLSQWVQHFRDYGGFAALSDPVGNYNVPYLYLLAAISYLPGSDLIYIKLFSVLFDLLLAWGGLRLVRAAGGWAKSGLTAFTVLLLLPTVVLNGADWGQCDSIWAALCVHALADALDGKHPLRSVSLLALAFAFKLQAIFIIPLWCALWFCGRVKFRHFFAFPAVFGLTMVPALLLGKPVGDILGVYFNQAGDSVSWETLNYNSPSVFALAPLDAELFRGVDKAAIGAAFLLMLAVLILLFTKRKKVGGTALTAAAAVLTLGIPFLLPYMHERYFYLGGVLLVILACLRLSAAPAALCGELASLGGYYAYLTGRYFMVFSLFGLAWGQLAEGLLMLFALVSSFILMIGALPQAPHGDQSP